MSALSNLSYFSRSAALGFVRSPFVHGAAVLSLAMALFVTGLAKSAVTSLESALGSLGGEVEFTVYLANGVADQTRQSIEQALRTQVGAVPKFVSQEDALRRLTAELGDLGSALQGLPNNPLPQSFEVAVPQERRSTLALSQLAASLRALPGVTAVDYGAQAVERLSVLSKAVKVGGWVAFWVVAFTSLVIVSAALQLCIYARREEIEIQKLVGATDFFVRVPFLLEGLGQGVLGALLASLGLWFFSAWATPQLSFALAPFLTPGTLPFDWASLFVELLGAGAAFGLLGSFVAVGRFLRA